MAVSQRCQKKSRACSIERSQDRVQRLQVSSIYLQQKSLKDRRNEPHQRDLEEKEVEQSDHNDNDSAWGEDEELVFDRRAFLCNGQNLH